MKGIMVQGTGSDVGKSLIATGLCRLFFQEGIKVTPFKSQNVTNDSYILADGKQIARSQAMQAEAAQVTPDIFMNPILLKPRPNLESELILFGENVEVLSGMDFHVQFYEKGLAAITASLEKLAACYDVVVIEGAGSPVEMNLRDRDLVNMQVAVIADVPVILVADIERGGVFANIVGTLALFTPEERQRVQGIIINKFHGEPSLFQAGIDWIEEYTGIPVIGVLPYLEDKAFDMLAMEMKRYLKWEKVKELIYGWEQKR